MKSHAETSHNNWKAAVQMFKSLMIDPGTLNMKANKQMWANWWDITAGFAASDELDE